MTEARGTTNDPRHVVDVRTLEMLVCPLSKTRLILDAEKSELISVVARLAFPIRRGVPMLALDESRNLEQDEIDRISRRPSADGIG